mmetsp:Transcript_29818/g.80706  ORF Transcript_29818/g.80706 Transcript_29818/m.80706 type:complete len:151 (-) Transcript_29818:86-538(-)
MGCRAGQDAGLTPAGCLRVVLAREHSLGCEEPLCGLAARGKALQITARSAELCSSKHGVERLVLQPPLSALPGDCLGWQYSSAMSLRVAFTRGGRGRVWWHRATPGPGGVGIFEDGEARTYSLAAELSTPFLTHSSASGCRTTQHGMQGS